MLCKILPIVTDFTPLIEQEGLKLHKSFRRIHDAHPMTLDETMCQEAAAYAAELARMGTLKPSSKEQTHGQGDNLSMGCSLKAGQIVTQAVTNWYEIFKSKT